MLQQWLALHRLFSRAALGQTSSAVPETWGSLGPELSQDDVTVERSTASSVSAGCLLAGEPASCSNVESSRLLKRGTGINLLHLAPSSLALAWEACS